MGRNATSGERLAHASGLLIAAALILIYVVWGTTYLAIRVVVDPGAGEAIPPFAMVAIRFALAGAAMLALVFFFARDDLRSLNAQVEFALRMALEKAGRMVGSEEPETGREKADD